MPSNTATDTVRPATSRWSSAEHPYLYEINTWPWLEGLSVGAGRRVELGCVPESRWDAIAELGFDAVWLMGVWTRSPAGVAVAMSNPTLRAGLRAGAARLPPRGRRRIAVLHPRLRRRSPSRRTGGSGFRSGRARPPRTRPDPRLRAQPRRPGSPVDPRPSGSAARGERRRAGERAAVVHRGRRPRPGVGA